MKSSCAFVQSSATVIYSRAIFVAVTSECRVKRVICKTWTGTFENKFRPRSNVCTVCLNYRRLSEKMKSLKSPIKTIFPAYIQKQSITKTCLHHFDPLKPHFYIVKLRFTGVCVIFLISTQKHRLWELIRIASPRRF